MAVDHLQMIPLTRKNSFPSARKLSGLDFRREFKGSVLERKAKNQRRGIISSLIGRISEWTGFPKKSPKRFNVVSDSPLCDLECPIDEFPCEILVEIFSKLDRSTAVKCREVCSKWKMIIEDSTVLRQALLKTKTLSRLCIRGVPKKESGGKRMVEMRWIDYDTQSCKAILLPTPLNINNNSLFFAFSQFEIQRIVIQDLSFTDEIVHFLRMNLHSCPSLSPVQLTLNNLDFGTAKSLTLHHLLAAVGKSLEVIEIQSVYGIRPLDFTDAHVSQLDATKIRRLVVDKIRLSGCTSRSLLLGDASLRLFISANNFPTLVLDRCNVTTGVVCDYSQEWLDSAQHDENSLSRHQVCTVKRCHRVKASHFEDECSKRRLNCRRSSVTRTTTIYNIQSEHGHDEFTFALCPVPVEEKKEEVILN
ncbi:hypothetical protein PENTCL1PPCAC_11496 [Pristionchus entomophagus]|uniref:F-box domain-containing protein n=1 Tax=Pristionchus entomophagus TaxID=358040 RepID=A0AAV5T157_9BILA|nr:hypothetical protein PENTCL1PPCAC_11496 [Pristionchus entomophagus]